MLTSFLKQSVYLNRICCTGVSQLWPYSAKQIFPGSTIVSRKASVLSPRRAMLYVPGHDKRKIQKIPAAGADCAVLDLEDGVAVNKKSEARESIANLPDDFNFGRTEHAVRVNSVESGLFEEDLRAVLSSRRLPSTIMIPKVDSVEQVQFIYQTFDEFSNKLPSAKDIGVFLFVESAKAVLDLRDICKSALQMPNAGRYPLQGLVFGSDDFCANIGATRTKDGKELLTARQMIVMIAKAFGIQVIDMVHIDYKDLEGLKKYSKEGAEMGFTGKQVIHPGQVETVQKAFSPSAKKIEWAKELIKLFEEHQKHGKGAFTFRGAMIDRPLLRQAQVIVQMADALDVEKTNN